MFSVSPGRNWDHVASDPSDASCLRVDGRMWYETKKAPPDTPAGLSELRCTHTLQSVFRCYPTNFTTPARVRVQVQGNAAAGRGGAWNIGAPWRRTGDALARAGGWTRDTVFCVYLLAL